MKRIRGIITRFIEIFKSSFSNNNRHGYLLTFFIFVNLINFVSLGFSNVSKTELLARTISDVAIDNTTTKSLNINYVSKNQLSRNEVSSLITDSKDYSLNKYGSEYYNARLLFNSNISNFFVANELESSNPTVLLSNIFSNHKNASGETVHDLFELKLMFPDSNSSYAAFDNFCYLRQSDADFMIQNNSSYETYQDLINETLHINYMNGNSPIPLNWKIANIILNNEGADSFYKNTYGTYILSYIDIFDFRGITVGFDYGTSIISNSNYINKLGDWLPYDDFDLSITNHNIIDTAKLNNEEIINLFRISHSQNDDSFYFVLAGSVELLFYFIFFYAINNNKTSSFSIKSFSLTYFVAFLVIYYFFFFLQSTVTINFLFFNTGAIVVNLLLLIIISLTIFFMGLFKKQGQVIKR